MKAYIISDAEFKTDTYERLEKLLKNILRDAGADVTEKQVVRGELAHCMGCFGCWLKTPGECVIKDGMTAINRTAMTSDAVIYLCPVVFGQASANMKDVIDRWLPNILPFFITRPDGSTMHPPRYEDYPAVIMIGYGEDLTAEDARLFTDITKKHRRNTEALTYTGNDEELAGQLRSVKLARVGGSL